MQQEVDGGGECLAISCASKGIETRKGLEQSIILHTKQEDRSASACIRQMDGSSWLYVQTEHEQALHGPRT